MKAALRHDEKNDADVRERHTNDGLKHDAPAPEAPNRKPSKQTRDRRGSERFTAV
mgnify:CR=1 FL=1